MADWTTLEAVRVAAREARRTANTVLTHIKQPHIGDGLSDDLRSSIVEDLEHASLYLWDAIGRLTADDEASE